MARFSVRVVNRSAFEPLDLARLFRACLKAHHVPAQPYVLETVPSYNAKTKRGGVLAAAGRAVLGQASEFNAARFFHGRKVWMACPQGTATGGKRVRASRWYMDLSTPRGFARWCWVLDHEVKHLVGWTDPELDKSHDPLVEAAMGVESSDGHGAHDIPALPAWALGFEVLDPKPAKPAPAPEALAAKAEERRQKKIVRAEAMLAKAEAKLRRAERAVTRWKRKLAGLSRAQLRLAAERG